MRYGVEAQHNRDLLGNRYRAFDVRDATHVLTPAGPRRATGPARLLRRLAKAPELYPPLGPLVVQPSKIHPQVIEIDSKLKSEISKVTFANSITLTPGTITMEIEDEKFYVHALSQKVADDLLTGEMEDRVAHVFDEK